MKTQKGETKMKTQKGETKMKTQKGEIKEQRGNYFVIDNIDSLPELKQGFTVELFWLS